MTPAKQPADGAAPTRRAYHHGDLRNALVDAATELVRTGGPEALVLREVARATGVSSTAAYRHFENHGDLVEAVKDRAIDVMSQRVQAALAATPPLADPVADAFRRIRATGQGYVGFALDEPGLFRLIFRQSTRAGRTALALAEGESDAHTPAEYGDASYLVMADALDELVERGVLPAERRAFTDIALWATVHGIATLLIDTNLAHLPEPAQKAAIERTFDVIFEGLERFATD